MNEFFDNFTKRLLNDLRTSWQKSAILAVLFCVGLCLWVPPLVRILTGTGKQRDKALAADLVSDSAQPDLQNRISKKTPQNWQQFQANLAQDKLLQPVSPNDIKTAAADPFTIDWSQFPPPLLFAEDTATERLPTKPVISKAPPLELNLKSTIIGRNRRAAMINSKLYREGSTFQIQQKMFQLKRVEHRQVVLHDGQHEFVLQLESQSDPGNIEISGTINRPSSRNRDDQADFQ